MESRQVIESAKENDDQQKHLSPEELIEIIRPLLKGAVRRACAHYGHLPTDEEIKSFCQRLWIWLLVDEQRRLQKSAGQAAPQTWLQSVVDHFVLNDLQRRKQNVSLGEFSPDAFSSPPTQEESLLLKEWQQALALALSKLTEHEQKLWELLYEEGWRGD